MHNEKILIKKMYIIFLLLNCNWSVVSLWIKKNVYRNNNNNRIHNYNKIHNYNIKIISTQILYLFYNIISLI